MAIGNTAATRRHQKIDLILIFDTFLENLLLEVLHLGTRPTNDEPSLLQNYLFDDDKKPEFLALSFTLEAQSIWLFYRFFNWNKIPRFYVVTLDTIHTNISKLLYVIIHH